MSIVSYQSANHATHFIRPGIFGYSHLLGGFGGGQSEYVRVPFGDVNLLKIPDNVPDEKGELQIYSAECLAPDA